MNILLRDATPLDFDPIAQISVEAYQEYSTVLDAESWQTMKNNLSNVENTAKIANFIVAEIVDEIVGAIAYYPPGRSNSKFFDSQWASLRLLAVAPKHRGKGIGKLLTKEGIVRAKEDQAEAVGLYTSEAMTVARKMYVDLGFNQVQELPSMLGLRYWLYVLPLNF
ncbi:MAG: GNAT family N-acetyltransferase [Waterburya sp.]